MFDTGSLFEGYFEKKLILKLKSADDKRIGNKYSACKECIYSFFNWKASLTSVTYKTSTDIQLCHYPA